jgi:8-oxo-dGTP diphosphatase
MGEVLLMQVTPAKLNGERKDYWDLPGGRVQKGDSVEDTLKREVLEETGINEITNIQPVSMVLSNLRIPTGNDESVGLILSVYACTVPNNTTVMLSDEHVAYDWFTSEKAAELLRVKYPEEFCEAIGKL